MENCQSQRRSYLYGALVGFQLVWKRLLEWYQQRRAYKQQMEHLREMDDRLLKDIGLARSDVDRITATRQLWDPQVDRERLLDRRYERR